MKAMVAKDGFSIILGALSILFAIGGLIKQPALSSVQTATPDSAWTDMFTGRHTRWDWNYTAGSGYKDRARDPEAFTVLEIGVTAASTSTAYSDCSLHEKTARYTSGILEMRLKANDDNSGAAKGTRGWGFWDGNVNVGNAAWFWSASSHSSPELQGLRAQVYRSGRLELNEPLDVDMREWHTYRVEMTPARVKFFVDDQEVAAIDRAPSTKQRVEIWIDNYQITFTPTGFTKKYLDITQDQSLTIDWVRYRPR